MVLVQLPMGPLLRAQRISKTFRDVIQRSLHLQRALYFLAAPPTQNGVLAEPVQNPLRMKKKFPKPTRRPWKLKSWACYKSGLGSHYELELDLQTTRNYCSRGKSIDSYKHGSPDESWRMLLFQPPPAITQFLLLDKNDRDIHGGWGMNQACTQDDMLSAGDKLYMNTVGSEDWRRYTTVKDTTSKTIIDAR